MKTESKNNENYQLAITYKFANQEYTDFLFQDEIFTDSKTIDQVLKIVIYSSEGEKVLIGEKAKEYLKNLNERNLGRN